MLHERSQKASNVQQTSQAVKPKTKVPSKLDMAKQLVKIGLPSSTDECIERWWEYRYMHYTRREAQELKQEERSRNPPKDMAKVTAIIQRSFRKNLKPRGKP